MRFNYKMHISTNLQTPLSFSNCKPIPKTIINLHAHQVLFVSSNLYQVVYATPSWTSLLLPILTVEVESASNSLCPSLSLCLSACLSVRPSVCLKNGSTSQVSVRTAWVVFQICTFVRQRFLGNSGIRYS